MTSFMGEIVITNDADFSESIRRESNANPPYGLVDTLPKIVTGAITDLLTSWLLFKTFSYRFFRWAALKKVNFINNKIKMDVNPLAKYTMPEGYMRQMSAIQAKLIYGQLKNVELNQILESGQWAPIGAADLFTI